MYNETASGWPESQVWDDDPHNAEIVAANKKAGSWTMEPYGGKGYWAYFTYTVSIAYAWDRSREDTMESKNVGYMDDEVVLSIGIDDKGQGFSKVKAGDLIQCLHACPGRERESSQGGA